MNAKDLRIALGITAYRLRRWLAQGLPHTRRGRAYDFDPPQVREWLLAQGLASTPTPARIAATRADVAAYFDVHERTVANWLAMGCPGEHGHYDLAAIAAWRSDQGKPPTADADGPRARLARLRGDREELRLAVDRRELIPADPTIRLISRTIHTAKARLDQLPEQLLAEIAEHLPADQLAPLRRRLQQTVDACYLALANIPTAEEFTGATPDPLDLAESGDEVPPPDPDP